MKILGKEYVFILSLTKFEISLEEDSWADGRRHS